MIVEPGNAERVPWCKTTGKTKKVSANGKWRFAFLLNSSDAFASRAAQNAGLKRLASSIRRIDIVGDPFRPNEERFPEICARVGQIALLPYVMLGLDQLRRLALGFKPDIIEFLDGDLKLRRIGDCP